MYIDLHVKYPSFLSDFNEKLNFLYIFSKYTHNIKFHENPSSESRVVLFRRTDRYDEAIVAFHNFAKASKKTIIFQIYSRINFRYLTF